MIPGNAQILKCPYCGTKKEVLSLVSGNTFRQVVWSDNKSIAPMLPKVSFVQKCPHCGKYYLLSRQKPEHGNTYSFEKGELNYKEIKEAWSMLKDTEDLTENERLSILIMQVWAFNDEYTRDKEGVAPKEEQDYIKDIIDMLIKLDRVDDLLKAELLRETGRFSDALDLLDNYMAENDFLEGLKNKFKEYALASETRPFIINADE